MSLRDNAANASCPCLTSLEAFGISSINSIAVTIDNKTFAYSPDYGQGTCSTHDANTEPSCDFGDSSQCTDSETRISLPRWCGASWCYVNGSACGLESRHSGSGGMRLDDLIDPHGELHYSYQTCGRCDTYTASPRDVLDAQLEGRARSLIIGLSITAFVILAMLLCVLCLYRRMRLHHAIAKEARDSRLMYAVSQKPAEPRELPDEAWFHLFLSHVWTTGANQMRSACRRTTPRRPCLPRAFRAYPPARCLLPTRCVGRRTQSRRSASSCSAPS